MLRLICKIFHRAPLTFPQRGKDGKDWQTCTECGQRYPAKVRFGKVEVTPC